MFGHDASLCSPVCRAWIGVVVHAPPTVFLIPFVEKIAASFRRIKQELAEHDNIHDIP
jgi:hypothetical protein